MWRPIVDWEQADLGSHQPGFGCNALCALKVHIQRFESQFDDRARAGQDFRLGNLSSGAWVHVPSCHRTANHPVWLVISGHKQNQQKMAIAILFVCPTNPCFTDQAYSVPTPSTAELASMDDTPSSISIRGNSNGAEALNPPREGGHPIFYALAIVRDNCYMPTGDCSGPRSETSIRAGLTSNHVHNRLQS